MTPKKKSSEKIPDSFFTAKQKCCYIYRSIVPADNWFAVLILFENQRHTALF